MTKICIFSHNSLKHDSRILKSARTLWESGHDIVCISLGKTYENKEAYKVVQGTFIDELAEIFRKLNFLARFCKKRLFGNTTASDKFTKEFDTEHGKKGWKPLSALDAFSMQIEMLKFSTIALLLRMKMPTQDFDVIYAHDLPALISGASIKEKVLKRQKRHIKLIWDAHEIYSDLGVNSIARSVASDLIIKKIMPQVDSLITVNQSLASHYQNLYNKKATVILNCTEQMSEVDKKTSPLRKNIYPKDREKILIYHGGFSRGRDILKVAHSFTHIKTPWHFVFMGNGPLLKEIQIFKKKITASKQSYFHILPSTPPSQLHAWLAGADLGIIPYPASCLNHLYCSPNKIWELASSQVPIISTDLIEISTRIINHNCGFLMKQGWQPEILATLLDDISRGDSLSQKTDGCISLFQEENWSQQKSKFLTLFLKD